MECDVIPASSSTADATTTSTTTNTGHDPFELKDPLGNLDSLDTLSEEEPTCGGFALNAVMIDSEAASVTLVTAPTHRPLVAEVATAPPPTTAAKSTVPSVATRRKQTKTTAASNSPTSCKAKKTTAVAKSTATTTHTSAVTSVTQASTMREVLASIPGFSLKPRRRTTKKMSTAAQIAQTREGCIDLETPDSILCGANLRSLLNKHTFALLPPLFQYKLVQLLPAVDRPSPSPTTTTTADATSTGADEVPSIRLTASSLNNEFFSRACLEWRERLSEGEFTPENQMKMRTDAEKEKSRLDPWKLKHFEPIWGRDRGERERLLLAERSQSPVKTETHTATANSSVSELDTVKPEITATSPPPPAPPKQSPRTVRALTRSSIVAAASASLQQNNLTVPTEATIIAGGSAAAAVVPAPNTTTTTAQPDAIVAGVVAAASAAANASIAAVSSYHHHHHHNHTNNPSKTPVPELLPIRVAAKPAQQRPTPAPSSAVASFVPAEPTPTVSRDRVDAAKPTPAVVKHRTTPPSAPPLKSSALSAADIIVISDSGDDQSCPSTTTTVLTTSAVSSAELTVTISSTSSAKPSSCMPTKSAVVSVSKAVVTTTASYTIPSGIEVIPLDSASGGSSAAKRHASKRSTPGSPDARNHIKISKYSHHPLQHHSNHHHHHQHSHNHHHLHHNENSISSGPVTSGGPAAASNKNNGVIGSDRTSGAQQASAPSQSPSCAISDVIQIIKLPESTCPLPTQSPIGMAEAPVPSISVAVTTISVATAQASSAHRHHHQHHHGQQQQKQHQQQQHLRSVNHAHHLPPKRTSTIQIIDTGMRTTTTKQTPTTVQQKTSLPSSRAAVHTNPTSIVRITPAMLSPLSAANVLPKSRSHNATTPPHDAVVDAIAIVDVIDSGDASTTTSALLRTSHPASTTTITTSEDDGGSSGGLGFAETPADHVFRAMVCRGDDVLCGDGRVMVPQIVQPQPQQPPAQSAAITEQVETVAREPEMFPPTGDAPVYEFEMGGDVAASGPNSDERSDVTETAASAAVVATVPATVDVIAELEPSIQVLDPMVAELDPIEQEFTDAENYVLESGEISADSSAFERATSNSSRIDTASAPATTSSFSAVLNTIAEHPTGAAPPATGEVIPMQETLEVRLKESITYPPHRNWPYKVMHQHHAAMQQQQQQQQQSAHNLHSPHPHRLGQQPTNDSTSSSVDQRFGATVAAEQVFDPAKSPDHDECAALPQMGGANLSSMVILSQPNFESTSQVKVELEVTLTPESEVSSSTIAAHAFAGDGAFGDGDTSGDQQRMQAAANRMANVPNIIPPTTIVCLPNPAPAPIGGDTTAAQTSHTTYMNAMMHGGSSGGGKPNSVAMLLPHHRFASTGSTSSSSSSSPSSNSSPTSRSSASSSPAPNIYTNNHVQRPPVSLSLPPPASGSPAAGIGASTSTVWPSQQQQQLQHQHQHHTTVASSSSLPYLSLATTQPMRAVPQPIVRARAPFASVAQQQQQQAAVVSMAMASAAAAAKSAGSSSSSGRGNRGGSNRPPPGAVNLERSYQICQAVIQNSPNRHQLKAQLRPPPSMLATPTNATAMATAASGATMVTAVTTVQSVMTTGMLPRRDDGPVKSMSNIAQKRAGIVHRQNSTGSLQPSVRHVFTTNQGIPVSMTVLPSGLASHHPMHMEQFQKHSIKQQQHPLHHSAQQMLPQHLHQQQQQQQQVIYSMAGGGETMQHQHQLQSMHGTDGGQYILVQNSGATNTTTALLAHDELPRSSSAPPAQNAHQQLQNNNNSGMSTTVSLPASSSASTNGNDASMRIGRPASLDMDGGGVEIMDTSEQHLSESSYFEQTVHSQSQKTIRSKGHHQPTAATGYMQNTTDGAAAADVADHPHPSSTQYSSQTSSAAATAGSNNNAHLAHHQYSTSATAVVRMDSTPPNCSCSMNAMVICQQCGIFCHDECTGSTKLCLSCVIR